MAEQVLNWLESIWITSTASSRHNNHAGFLGLPMAYRLATSSVLSVS